MSTVDKVTHWGETHHAWWLDILRVGLGSILFYKGVMFGKHPEELMSLAEGRDFSLLSILLIHYIPMIHIVGGIMIALGLLTRLAILFQLPILLGAVILTGQSTGIFELYSEFGLALSILSLLILFLVVGSGPYSLDEEWSKRNG
jgi:putative oxidoreductase